MFSTTPNGTGYCAFLVRELDLHILCRDILIYWTKLQFYAAKPKRQCHQLRMNGTQRKLSPTANGFLATSTPASTTIRGSVFSARPSCPSSHTFVSKLTAAFSGLGKSLLLFLPSIYSLSLPLFTNLARSMSLCAPASKLPLSLLKATHGIYHSALLPILRAVPFEASTTLFGLPLALTLQNGSGFSFCGGPVVTFFGIFPSFWF